MLRFPEEIMLLLLDDEGGDFVRVPEWSVQCALAGAVLMDLALENRIDTDPNWLTVIDPTPVGDDLLDPTLERISQADGERDTRFWIQDIAQRAGPIRERVLERLVEHGILHVRDDSFLWVFQSRRYPVVDGKADREVKLRIMEVLFSDEIPDPRGHRDRVPGGGVRDLSRIAVAAGTGTRIRPNRAGAQAGPDRPGGLAGGLGHRDVAGPNNAPHDVSRHRRAARGLCWGWSFSRS